MKKWYSAAKLSGILISAVFAAGCATLFASGPQSVEIKSDPPGATYHYGPFSGTTPDSIEVPRKSLASFATFELAGYKDTAVPVETGVQGTTWWDLLFPLGFVIDFVTGNANRIETPIISAHLLPLAPVSAPAVAAPPPHT